MSNAAHSHTSPTSTITSKVVHVVLRIAALALVVTAVVALGIATNTTPYAGVALPASPTHSQAYSPAATVTPTSDQPTNEAQLGAIVKSAANPDVAVVLGDVVSDAMWEDLRAQGYTGNPRDGMEALYVPRDVAAAACRTDLDCNLYGQH
jgi:hypothetical protein